MNFKKIVSLMLACALTISPLNSLAFAENDSTLTAAQVNVALLPLSKVKIESLKERIEKLVEDIEKLGEDIEKLGEDIEKLGEKIEKLYNMSKIMKKVALLWIFLQIFLM